VVQISTEDGVPVVVCSGELTPAELLSAYSHFLDVAADAPKVCWDLSAASLNAITLPEMRMLAADVARLGRGRRKRGKAAVVCQRNVDFGLARMFVTLLSGEGSPVEFEVFRDAGEARAWLSDGTRLAE
jgi:hypothetical protein